MADKPTESIQHLIFEQFRELREHHDARFNELTSKLNDVMAEVQDATLRLGAIETQYSNLSNRLDRIGGDVVRIKRRLELSDAPEPSR